MHLSTRLATHSHYGLVTDSLLPHYFPTRRARLRLKVRRVAPLCLDKRLQRALIKSGSERFSRFQCSRTAHLYGSAFSCSACSLSPTHPLYLIAMNTNLTSMYLIWSSYIRRPCPLYALSPDRACLVSRAEAVRSELPHELDRWSFLFPFKPQLRSQKIFSGLAS